MKRSLPTLILLAVLAVILGPDNAEAAKKKKHRRAQAATASAYDNAKKSCLRENPYIEGKELQTCIKRTKAQKRN